MQYWLLKSEPDVWSIDQQKKAGIKGAPWDGVRNYQAAKNLKSMREGDQCFFYHSNIGKEIVGIVEVIKEAYLDKTDKSGRFVAVNVKFLKKLDKPVDLDKIKIKDQNIFVVDMENTLRCFSIKSGEILWSTPTELTVVSSQKKQSIVIVNNLIIFSEVVKCTT